MPEMNPYMKQALKAGGVTALVVALAFTFLKPTTNNSALQGTLITTPNAAGKIPTQNFDVTRTAAGFTAPADTHVLFTIPPNVRIPRSTMIGGALADRSVRYWGYCFTGNEAKNKADGKRGKQLYDGLFFYSRAEVEAQAKAKKPVDTDSLLGIMQAQEAQEPAIDASEKEILFGWDTCYLMTEYPLAIGVDTDGDNANDEWERTVGTNPRSTDTDGDGIPDGDELYRTKTNPLLRDTDNDGLTDKLEDKDVDGLKDPTETSPLEVDSDRDGFCDGNGYASACPEGPRAPVRGEDKNQNGEWDCEDQSADECETKPYDETTFNISDWTWAYNRFKTQTGNR